MIIIVNYWSLTPERVFIHITTHQGFSFEVLLSNVIPGQSVELPQTRSLKTRRVFPGGDR